MATLREALKTYLEADATLAALLTGGIYDADELQRDGLTVSDVAREANGVTMKPTAVIRWRGSSPTELLQSPASERRFVEVWFYADRGYAVVEQAKLRVKALLHRKQLGPTTDGLGLGFFVFAGDLGEFAAAELQDAAADRSRYYVDFTRR